jgi:hypothetical protein
MNTVLSTRVDEQPRQHPPSWLSRSSTPARVSVADRVALHVGLALVTWSRRPRRVVEHTARHARQSARRLAEARALREGEWALRLHLGQPRR